VVADTIARRLCHHLTDPIGGLGPGADVLDAQVDSSSAMSSSTGSRITLIGAVTCAGTEGRFPGLG
jgi:hypothetical protein